MKRDEGLAKFLGLSGQKITETASQVVGCWAISNYLVASSQHSSGEFGQMLGVALV
jgi:hypothetical protein